MSRIRLPAVTAVWTPLAIGGVLFASAPAHAVDIFSGSSQTVVTGATFPPSIVHLIPKTGNWDSLREFRETEVFDLPFSTSLSSIDAIATSGNIAVNGHLASTTFVGDLSTSFAAPPLVVGGPSPGHESISGSFGTGGVVISTTFDTLALLTDNPDDHRSVTLHKTLQLTGGADTRLFLDSAVHDQDYHMTASSNAQVFGDGIGDSLFGGSTYSTFEMVDGTDTRFHSSEAFQRTIDFSLHLNLNEFRNFSITLRESAGSELFDGRGGGINQFDFSAAYGLTWSGDSFVTDDRTGAFLHGMGADADSAFNYVGLDVGGPGEDLNAHPIRPAAAPEPATWALLIGGFAIAGTGLRRARRRERAAAGVAGSPPAG